MIKTIIFDIGQVLLHYNPKSLIDSRYSEPDASFIFETLFLSPLWLDLDRGTRTYEEVLSVLSAAYPKYRDAYAYLLASWTSILKPIVSTTDLLPALKKLGFQLLYLSNFHKEAFPAIIEQNSFFQYFDGGLVSFQHHLLKPEAEIYQVLSANYGLNPDECLFIDDSLSNILAAKQLGYHTIHFTSNLNLCEILERYCPSPLLS